MIIVKNKRSGKSFIYLKEIDWDKIQLITPTNRIKTIERRLFKDEIEGNELQFTNAGMITTAQLRIYRQHLRNQQEETFMEINNKNKERLQVPSKSRIKHSLKQQTNSNQEVITMKTIEIDDDIYAYLQSKANPFEEHTPNDVIRRILGLKKKTNQVKSNIRKNNSTNGSTTLPKGCTVDGIHYKNGSQAIRDLLSTGKIGENDTPTSNYNAHLWLRQNSSRFGFGYERDAT